jgi:putative (di)nucleoside polyphosphate hydrolase
MIDRQGFRANVGIILMNEDGRVFYGKRLGMAAWQFPQGGIEKDETTEEAMYRELQEETGLRSKHVDVIGSTRSWLRYRLPKKHIRQNQKPVCIGQKQIWFLLLLVGSEEDVKLDWSPGAQEFEEWRWVDYWEPIQSVVPFKRSVYKQALQELAEVGRRNCGLPPE